MYQRDLFDIPMEAPKGWRPPDVLPELSNVKKLCVDAESTGKKKHEDDAVGFALYHAGGGTYLPFGHRGGGNLDPGIVKRWAERELRNKTIVNVNTGFDSEIFRRFGVDLEAQGCALRDIAHSAALLNEHRFGGFNLNSLAKEYLGVDEQKIPINKERIAEYPAWQVAPYAIQDAKLAYHIDETQMPLIAKEDLGRVLQLESDLIYVVNEMERNGARLDVEKLHKWKRLIQEDIEAASIKLWRTTGKRINPDSAKDMDILFRHCGLNAHVSYAAEILKELDYPEIQAALKIRRFKSMLSKYIVKYLRAVEPNGIIRFSLYQLRGDEYGTITGRFSSANINIQQVMKVEKQEETLGLEYIIRELFIPDDGFDFFAADASQIEFRLFAHYSGSERLIKAYNDDPDIDFHMLVTKMMLPGVAEEILKKKRKDMKHNNFGKLYGMGVKKLCDRLGYSCTCGEPEEFWREDAHDHTCPAITGLRIAAEYDREFPEAKELSNEAMRLAERRGWVKDLLGRRGRFPDKRGYHKALNKVIQGSAATINKVKLLETYRNRKELEIHKMRLTVHDEIAGDNVRRPDWGERYKKFLDQQSFNLKVPILWDVAVGRNWKECA